MRINIISKINMTKNDKSILGVIVKAALLAGLDFLQFVPTGVEAFYLGAGFF